MKLLCGDLLTLSNMSLVPGATTVPETAGKYKLENLRNYRLLGLKVNQHLAWGAFADGSQFVTLSEAKGLHVELRDVSLRST